MKRTTTGILSNRRPVSGTAANSGTSPDSETPRLGLIANAKREAAKRGLHSRFFRGPVLGPSEGNLSDGPSGSGSSSGKSEAPAVDEVKLKVSQSPKLPSKSVEDRKKELKVDKRTTKKDGTQEGVFVKQSEEAMARKARKRDKRAAKIKARITSRRRDNRQKRMGKRKRESTKNETVVEEISDT